MEEEAAVCLPAGAPTSAVPAAWCVIWGSRGLHFFRASFWKLY